MFRGLDEDYLLKGGTKLSGQDVIAGLMWGAQVTRGGGSAWTFEINTQTSFVMLAAR